MAYLGHELQECMKTYKSVNILDLAYGSVNHTLSFSVSTAKLHGIVLYNFTLHFSHCVMSARSKFKDVLVQFLSVHCWGK